MLKITPCCDVCQVKLPVKKVEIFPFVEVEVVEVGRTKEWDTHMLFEHLCPTCALKIDNIFLKAKLELAQKGIK